MDLDFAVSIEYGFASFSGAGVDYLEVCTENYNSRSCSAGFCPRARLQSRCTLARICGEIDFARVVYNSRDTRQWTWSLIVLVIV
jgi:hypothetical protein